MGGVGALYVHVPFCVKKCAYCDFASWPTSTGDPCLDRYVDDRIKEIRQLQGKGLLEGCRTAYIGGGTPTLLGASRITSIIRSIRNAVPTLSELTCEANPDSLSDSVIEALADARATRISIGVQSLEDAELVGLGRVHSAAQAQDRVRAAVLSGLDVSVDLMCAIPRQTDSSWLHTLTKTIELGVGHVSVYPLSIEEGTPLQRRYANSACDWNDEDVQAERMEIAEGILTRAGFERYEVSSYARHGKRCSHNIAYWTGIPYIGLGKGASSMLGPDEYDLARCVFHWLPPRKAGVFRTRFSTLNREVEFLNEREAWAEDLMLGMRLTDGIETEKLGNESGIIKNLIGRGLVEERGSRIVPTHDGWLLGNELYGALWDLAEG